MPAIPLPALFLPGPANPELLTRLIKAMSPPFVEEHVSDLNFHVGFGVKITEFFF